MERVMITSRSGNVYFDQRGRPLRTMGDINVSVGQWVWTNGTTIYGHQSAGYNPPVIGGNLNGVPIWDPPYQKFDYTDKSGNIKDLIGDVRYNWQFFVNDKNHFYSAEPGKIYNLKIGKITSGPSDYILDAEVSNDGELYQITSGSYAEFNDQKYTLPKYFMEWDYDHTKTDKKEQSTGWHIEYSDYDIGTGKTGVTSTTVKIYKGTDIIQEIDLKQFFDNTLKSDIKNYVNKYKNADAGGELIDGDRVPPDDFDRTWGVNIINAKIFPDGRYKLLGTIYINRTFFPWVSYQFDKFDYYQNPIYRWQLWWMGEYDGDDPIAPDVLEHKHIKSYYIANAIMSKTIVVEGKIGDDPVINIIRTSKNAYAYYAAFPSKCIRQNYLNNNELEWITPDTIDGPGTSKILQSNGTKGLYVHAPDKSGTTESQWGWFSYNVITSRTTYNGESLYDTYYIKGNADHAYYTVLSATWNETGSASNMDDNVTGSDDITVPIQDNSYAVYHGQTNKSDIYVSEGNMILSGFDKINPTSKVSLCNIGKTYFLGVMGSLYKIENGSYTDTGIMQYNTRLRKGNLSLLKRGIKKLS